MKHNTIKEISVFSLCASFSYCLVLYFFLKQDRFESAWIMMVGNLFFGISVSLYMLYKLGKPVAEASQLLIRDGFFITFLGIILCALIAFAELAILIPNYFTSNWSQIPANSAAQEMATNNGQLTMAVYMNLVLGNLIVGSFGTIIYIFSARSGKSESAKKHLV